MSIYIFDLLVGYEANGVDNSQAHRARVFSKMNLDYYYIFSVIPSRYDFSYFRNLGLPKERMLIAPFFLVGEKSVESTISVEEMILRLSLEHSDCIECNSQRIVFQLTAEHKIILWFEEDRVFQVEHLYLDKLYQRDYYTSYLICREYLQKDGFNWNHRLFYNSTGGLVYEGFQISGKIRYRFGSDWIGGEHALMEYFIKSLSLSKKDTVIMDRISGFPFSQALLKYASGVKKGVVLHSIHQFRYGDMNYEYFYLFKYATEFDFIIVSTELQKIELGKYLLDLNLSSCPIVVIPAASIEELNAENKERVPFSAMLAARLDPRKQIDLAILAAIKVKEKLPHFHLNIYGKGSQYDKLNQIILENNAQEYIKLCGYQKLTDEFKKYQLYLSTSSWETLGITLLEAVANGLGIVGLDAPYGGPTFIENTKNGYLIAENESKSRDELVEKISDGIINYFKLDQDKVVQNSYAIASNYLDEVIIEKWYKLLVAKEES